MYVLRKVGDAYTAGRSFTIPTRQLFLYFLYFFSWMPKGCSAGSETRALEQRLRTGGRFSRFPWLCSWVLLRPGERGKLPSKYVSLADKTGERRGATTLIPSLLAITRTEALWYHAGMEWSGGHPGPGPPSLSLLSQQPLAPPSAWPSWRTALYNCSSHSPDLPLWVQLSGPVMKQGQRTGSVALLGLGPKRSAKKHCLHLHAALHLICIPTRDWPRLACECPGVSGGGVGQWWLATGSGARSEAVQAWDLLKEVAIIFSWHFKIPFDHWKQFNPLRMAALSHLGVTWACFGNTTLAHVYSPPNSNSSAKPISSKGDLWPRKMFSPYSPITAKVTCRLIF